jgi:hypothetical protein
MRRWTAAAVLALGAGLVAAPAHADDSVVVPGTRFPATGTFLTYFGCVDLFHADQRGPQALLTRDEAAPLGRRAVDLSLPGTGTAAGSVSMFTSIASAVSSLSVRAAAGSGGVAYTWYLAPEMGPGEVWSGRADLTAGSEGWQQVDATDATFTWTRYDAATGAVLEDGGAATIEAFTAEHGDGPGYVLTGFGCDGRTFGVDAIRTGVPGSITTYDLEGWVVSTSIAASRPEVPAGESVTLTGRSVDAASQPMGAVLELQARPRGAAEFTTVAQTVVAAADGTVTATVTPEVTTEYRWFFAERGYADEHVSPVTRVVVKPAPSDVTG